jgi:hypothetical protein
LANGSWFNGYQWSTTYTLFLDYSSDWYKVTFSAKD